jgi:hypothetical protein
MSRIPVSQRFGKGLCHGGCDETEKKSHAKKICQLLHVSVHEIPGGRGSFSLLMRLITVSAALLFWLFAYPPSVQLRSIIAATVYTFIEYIFTYFSDGKPFTSFAQFWGNLLYTPILLDVYWNLIVGTSQTPSTFAAVVYIFFFPFNVWLLEIILDLCFIFIYGRNVAWCYCTYNDSFVGGSIRFGHSIFWLIMGTGCLVIYPTTRVMTDEFTWSLPGTFQ